MNRRSPRILGLFVLLSVGCGGSVAGDPGASIADSGADGTPPTHPRPDDAVSPPPDAPSFDASPTPTPVDATVPGCMTCLVGSLKWGYEGGFVAYVDTSSIDCRTYAHQRDPVATDPASQRCTADVQTCAAPGAPSLPELRAALDHPDVVAALAAAGSTPVLFGHDDRPSDGAVYRIVRDGKTLDLGGECTAGGPPCTPIPTGLRVLADFLRNFDKTYLTLGTCKSVFPGP